MKNLTEYIQLNESATAVLIGQILGLSFTMWALSQLKKPEEERFHPIDKMKEWLKDKVMVNISNKIGNDTEINNCINSDNKEDIWKQLEKKLTKEEIDYLKNNL